MKIYVFYTPQIIPVFELLKESAREIPSIEIVPLFYNNKESPSHLRLGDTHKNEYMDLMLKRWEIHIKNVKDNLGQNIVILDADCVFNPCHQDFTHTINEELKENDFCFQHDTNSYMKAGANAGLTAVKCSPKTLSFFEKWFSFIEKKKERQAGYPQLEWNDALIASPDIKFKILPPNYGYYVEGCRFYHAISGKEKQARLEKALMGFLCAYSRLKKKAAFKIH